MIAVAVALVGEVPAGCLALWIMPSSAGVSGYVGGIVIVTAGYSLFQAANNTAAMAEIGPDQTSAGCLRHAQPVEEPGLGDGRIRNGCRIRAGFGCIRSGCCAA